MKGSNAERARMAASGGGGAPATLVPGLYTDYLPRGMMDRARDFFGYAVQQLPLAVNAIATPTFSVNTDADFLAVALSGVARDPAAPTTVFAAPAITMQVTLQGASRNLYSQAVDWYAVVGTAQEPAYMPYPKLIARGSTVTLTFTNLDAVQAYNVRLVVLGFKIFSWSREDGE